MELVIALVVALLFVLGDRVVNRADRGTLGHYLLGTPGASADVHTLPDTFLSWFDQLLAVQKTRIAKFEFYLPSFRRSLIFSCIALLLAAAMWTAKKGFFEPDKLNTGIMNAHVGLPLVLIPLLVDLPTPDNSVDGAESWHQSIELCHQKAEHRPYEGDD